MTRGFDRYAVRVLLRHGEHLVHHLNWWPSLYATVLHVRKLARLAPVVRVEVYEVEDHPLATSTTLVGSFERKPTSPNLLVVEGVVRGWLNALPPTTSEVVLDLDLLNNPDARLRRRSP